MALGFVQIGRLSVSRMIIGGNPFSGFSHQTPQKDDEMRHFYTTARIKETLRTAERLGLNTHLGRADHHVMRYLMEYWDQGGALQWIAQTCPEVGTIARGIDNALRGGAKACFVHGGVMDYLYANNQLSEVPPAIAKIRAAGLPAGIAGHQPEIFEWAATNLDVDFFMCSYYNPTARDKNAEHKAGATEWFRPEDRQRMVELIQTLPRPVIHYKVMAAGRNDPAEALAFVARHLRPQDAVCIGINALDFPDSLRQNVELLEKQLAAIAPSPSPQPTGA